ncbi:MAG: four-carbon acid sugar kinase family protein [Prevotella sp.]
MIVIISDDITGAAEIAGIAHGYGMTTVLTTGEQCPKTGNAEVVVFAADTRSMSEEEACDTMRRIATPLKEIEDLHVFKKIDSVLRGHVIAEMQALMDALQCPRALLVPQNPSKQRIIRNGEYLIENIPLHQTPFRDDPEYPAITSQVEELLQHRAQVLQVEEVLPAAGICVANAESIGQVAVQTQKCTGMGAALPTGMGGILIGGAADAFGTWLKQWYADIENREKPSALPPVKEVNRALIVCGSTQSKSIVQLPYLRAIDATEVMMPENVFHGNDEQMWFRLLQEEYEQSPVMVMGIGDYGNFGAAYALRLKKVMAQAVYTLIMQHPSQLLLIEGGATAFAILSKLRWTTFSVEGQYAPGVVGIRHGHTHIILKPGSYPWGAIFGNYK